MVAVVGGPRVQVGLEEVEQGAEEALFAAVWRARQQQEVVAAISDIACRRQVLRGGREAVGLVEYRQ
jgi:hypothetical protein